MYSGVCIGGPFHGKAIQHSHNFITFTIKPKLDFSKPITSREEIAIPKYTYLHSEEYTEWGEVARVFIWSVSGALPRAEREKFILTTLTGDGLVKKVTEENQKLIWPDCPADWWHRDTPEWDRKPKDRKRK